MAERKTRTFDGAAPSTTIRCTEGLNEMAEELAVSKQASAPWYRAALIIPIDPALGVLRQASVGALMIRGTLSLESGVIDNWPRVTYLLRINKL
jgi:hypothetical protein